MKKRISIIVAADKNRGIGKTTLDVGKLLWDIPEDLRRFRELTMGHPVIMGRKTFESVLSYIKKPFPGRTNIVVTRDPEYKYEGVIVVHSLEKAIEEAQKAPGGEEVFITGGGQIFEQGLPLADRLYLTLVDGQYDADTFFPDYSEFKKVLSREDKVTPEGIKFSWLILEK
jgi:dihydrofolate reductase